MATRGGLRSGKEFRAFNIPEFAFVRVRVPAVVFADVPGDSVCSEAVLDGGFHDESIPTPLMEAAGDEGGHLSVPPSPPGGRKRSSAELESDAEGPGADQKAKGRKAHRQRKRHKRRIKEGDAQHDERRLSILESAFLWDRCMMSISSLPHAQSAFSGRTGVAHDRIHGPRMQRLLSLADLGFRYFADDFSSDEVPLLASDGTVFALLVAWPQDWDEVTEGAAAAIRECYNKIKGETVVKFTHTRGTGFAQVGTGITHGLGTKGGGRAPLNKEQKNDTIQKAVDKLMKNKYILALFAYLEGPFKTWFPRHHAAYQGWLTFLESQNPLLQRPYPNASFASVSFNVGPRTVCKSHRDQGNDAAGICADIGLGNYNHRLGGHIVLHEARAILEMRPGRMLLFPSAAITHENIPIDDDEDRMSATAHFAGGIPQHIAQGMQGQTDLMEDDMDKFNAIYNSAANASRWEDAVSRFMTLQQLKEYWAPHAPAAGLS